MKTSCFILLIFYFSFEKVIISEGHVVYEYNNIEINKYLRNQLMRATNLLARSFEKKTRIRKNIPQPDISFDQAIHRNSNSEGFSDHLIFAQHDIFGTIYAVDGKHTFKLINGTYLDPVIKLKNDRIPEHMEVVSWSDKITLFVIKYQDDIVRVYQSTIVENPVQTIQLQFSTVKCFEHHGIYCLFVTEAKDAGSMANLFKWVGTHFDIEESLKVPPTSSVTTFKWKSDVLILLVPQRNQGKVSLLLRWTGKSLIKVQNLKFQSSCVHCIQSFEFENKYYVISERTILLWNGHRLVHKTNMISKADLGDPSSVYIGHLQSTTLIFIFYKHYINVYNPRKDFHMEVSHFVRDKIISATVINLNPDDYVLMYVTDKGKKAEMVIIPFTVESNEQEILGAQADALMQCLSSLQNILLKNTESIAEIEKHYPLVLRTDIPQNYPGVLKIGESTLVRAGSVCNGKADNNYLTSPSDLLESVVNLGTKARKLNSLRNRLLYKSRPNVITSSLHVLGGVSTVEGNLGSVSVPVATGPGGSIFLERPTAPESIESVLVTQSINTRNLKTGPGTIIDNLLKSAGNQEITGKYSGNTLIIGNILPCPGKINDVPLENLVRRRSKDPIKGTKTIQTLLADNVNTTLFNQVNTLDWINSINTAFEDSSVLYENISVRNLQVEYLNSVKWDDFVSSLYLDSEEQSSINGDIIFKSRARIHSARLEEIFGIPFDDFLTKTTDQAVTSNITIANLHTQAVKAKAINGLDFGESVATAKGRAIKNAEINHLNVAKDLTLNDNSDLDKQIPGTKTEELLQMYNGKVIIKGSLTIPNLYLEAHAKVQVQDTNVSLNIPQHYWTKSSDQIIRSDVTVDKPIQAPQVYLDKLNSVDWAEYVTIDKEFLENSHLIFQKAHIAGDLSFDRKSDHYNPYLKSLHENAVRITGIYTIEGDVDFTGEVHIKSADTEMIDDIAVSDLVSKSEAEHVEFTGVKRIPSLNVSSIVTTDADIEILNRVDMNNYLRSILLIDEPTVSSTLHFDSITAGYLNLQSVNILGAKAPAKEEYRSKDGSQKTVHIAGDVHLEEIIGLQTVNDIKLAEYLALVVRGDSIIQVGGHKIFEAPMTINENFITPMISNVNVEYLYKYGVSKSKLQNITGHYKILDLTTESFVANFINDLSLDQLVDISSPLSINSNIWFKAPLNVNDLLWSTSCNSGNLESSLYDMPDRIWESIYIKENLQHISLTKSLKDFVEYAVTDAVNKSITGKVTFAGTASFEDIETINYINNIDVNAIAGDALLKTSSEVQHISGRKTFVGPVSLSQAEIHGDFTTPVVNGIKIKEVNGSLVWKHGDAIISGSKVLAQNVFVDNLQVQGLINGVALENVVFLDDNRPLPKTTFNTLQISEHLQAREINGREFDDFLNRRVRLHGAAQNISAHVQFPQLHIAGPSYIVSINGLVLDEVVFTDIVDTRPIMGLKIFDKGLIVKGDMEVQLLNDFPLRSAYQNSIRKDKDYYMSQVTFSNAVNLANGLHVEAYENQSWLNFYAQPVPDTPYAEQIETKLNYTFEHVKPYDHYLYLEPSDIKVPIPPSRRVDTIKPGFLHLWDSTTGEICGLPTSCSCTLQHTVDISNQKTVYVLPGNTLRLLSYYNDGIGVNVFTNTVSTSSSCSSTYEEYSYISWLKPLRNTTHGSPIGDITIDQQRFPGYLSDAKFFRSNSNRLFLVLAMYYDKTKDSYDVDSLLVELSTNLRTTNIIQQIPTRSAIALELFHSSRGTHLIVCNAPRNENVQAYLEIMKFNEDVSSFELSRTISTEGCGLLTSAILRREQFIFVGDQNHKILRITRYVEQLNMFHYFQSFIYDSSLRGIHIFYPEGSSMDEAFLCVTTDDGNFYIYVYTYIEGWKQISAGYLKNAQDITSFRVNNEDFLFISSTYQNVIFKVVRQRIP